MFKKNQEVIYNGFMHVRIKEVCKDKTGYIIYVPSLDVDFKVKEDQLNPDVYGYLEKNEGKIKGMIAENKIAEEIKKFNTREEVREYLVSLKLKKNELLNIGKNLNCHVNAKDNKERLIDWIVNGTIGAKLRVEAIADIDLSK